jgi:predicted ABC-type ATPase
MPALAFETVMSHPSKLALLDRASLLGDRVMLVSVGTNDPQVNVERVALRVRQGRHDVPMAKIINRYDLRANCLKYRYVIIN